MPLFFANTGLRTDLTQLSSSAGPIFLVWALASVGKIAPAFFPDKRRHGDTQKGPELPKGVKDSERAHPKQRSEGQGVLKKETTKQRHISENTCDEHIGLLLSPPKKSFVFWVHRKKKDKKGDGKPNSLGQFSFQFSEWNLRVASCCASSADRWNSMWRGQKIILKRQCK